MIAGRVVRRQAQAVRLRMAARDDLRPGAAVRFRVGWRAARAAAADPAQRRPYGRCCS